MSIHLYISIVLLTSTILSNVNSKSAKQQYVIRKDFFNGVKAAEFTVYDKTEKHVYYRIESDVVKRGHNIELIAYPSKQEIGVLRGYQRIITYVARFSILNPKSNEWDSGSIEQIFKWTGDLYNISFAGNGLTLEKEFGSWTYIFRDPVGGEILAEFQRRPASILWTAKYDMKIFSNKFPEPIYFLGLAARDEGKTLRSG